MDLKAESQQMVALSYSKVVLLQALLGICFVVSLWLFNGSSAAVSAAIGVGIAVLSSMVYARLALVSKREADSAGAILRAHFTAEISKVVTVIVLFAVVMIFMKWVAVGWLFAAFIVASAGYWISLLVVK
jgi:F0F1-type ATP synthase assembly protein I